MTRLSATTAVVLAGGRSSRFGDDPKAAATLDGRPLVTRVVGQAHAATGRTPVVAAGSQDKRAVVEDALSREVRYVGDADWCAGPLAGICGALTAVSASTVFLCACDMPLLSARAISWLLGRHAETDAEATVPVDEAGEPQLLHGVYETVALENYCTRRPDTHCLRSLVSGLSVDTVVPAETPEDVDLRQSAVNVNTRAELASLRHRTNEEYSRTVE